MSNAKWPHTAYHAVTGRAVGATNMTAKDKAWLSEYETCHMVMRNCQYENSVLKDENQRLKNENEFMVRLINDRAAHMESSQEVTALMEALARCRHQASYTIGGIEALQNQLKKIRGIVNEAIATYRNVEGEVK